ncbi:MAG: hypothetical protein AAF558_10305 [Verrucomicrobiota bacterium]
MIKRIFDPNASKKGVALVMALSAIALMTIVIVAFFSRALLNRQISEAATQNIKADLMARAALDLAVGQLREEIRDGTGNEATTTNGITRFRPDPDLANGDRAIVPSVNGTVESSAGANLLKVSGASFFTRAGSVDPQTLSSTQDTDSASLNRRYVSEARWYDVNVGGAGLGDNGGTSVPRWNFMTRNNGVQGSPAIADASNSANDDFVVGRFAFNVYDLSGLMDINIGGTHSGSVVADDFGRKGSLAYSDLSAIPGITEDSLVQWRNRSSYTNWNSFQAWALGGSVSGADQKYYNAADSGHISIAQGDNTFVNRRDVVRAAQQNQAGLTQNALPYVTHWSRSLDAPTFRHQSVSTLNPDLSNVRVTGSFTRRDGTTAQVGENLVRKFSLSNLAWLTYQGPAAGASAANIKSYFGLEWNSTDDWWEYTSPDSTSVATRIKTLDEIAGTREPDFFELLQAAIINESLGQSSDQTLASTAAIDASSAIQIIRIGANIIDQYDEDNFPSSILFNDAGALEMSFFGIENLPYIEEIFYKYYGNGTGNGNNIKSHFAFELWNPHKSFSGNAALTPDRVRVNIASGRFENFIVRNNGGWEARQITSFPVSSGIPTSSGGLESFRANPRLVSNAADSSFESVLGYNTLEAYDYTIDTSVVGSDWNRLVGVWLNSAIVTLEYEDASGNWRPYSSFAGISELPATGFVPRSTGSAWWLAQRWEGAYITGTTDPFGLSYIKSDPRTYRFGTSGIHERSWNTVPYNDTRDRWGRTLRPNDGGTAPSNSYGYLTGYSGNTASPKKAPRTNFAQTGGYYFGALVENTAAQPYYYEDRDGVVRPGDGYLGANPMGTNTSFRPVVLNRPFRSVGELGYIYRDMPWKTLDLFSTNSADSGLLDVFTVKNGDVPVVAGKVNLNTLHREVLEAILTGVGTDEDSISTSDLDSPQMVAQEIVNSSSATLITNPTDFVNTSAGLTNLSYTVKSQRESAVRALAENLSTRTWNLFVDVIVQTGSYPTSAGSLTDFSVNGERRYWLSVAIDRYTGKVIDRQLELAYE